MLHRFFRRIRSKADLVLTEDMPKMNAKLHVRQTRIRNSSQLCVLKKVGCPCSHKPTSNQYRRADPQKMGGNLLLRSRSSQSTDGG